MRPTLPLLKKATRRLALTSKTGGKDYYKGFGSGAMGSHTKYGGYKIAWQKVRTYSVPDLSDCELSPFVHSKAGDVDAEGKLKDDGPKDDFEVLAGARMASMTRVERERRELEHEMKKLDAERHRAELWLDRMAYLGRVEARAAVEDQYQLEWQPGVQTPR